MNKYLVQLSEHLASQPVEFHNWEADSILSFLYCCFAEDHPMENDRIRGCYEKLEPAFEGLPREISNQLFRNIADLCVEYELAAFIEGLRIGVALERELQAE